MVSAWMSSLVTTATNHTDDVMVGRKCNAFTAMPALCSW